MQGMPDSVADATLTWQAVLYFRLTAQYAQLGSRARTTEAEAAISWPHFVYFYVGRPHPDYGATVALHVRPGDDFADWAVTPFDTGGLVHGRVLTHNEMTAKEKVALIDRWTRTDLGYVTEMDDWIGAAFEDYAGYVRTARPAHHLVEEIDLPRNSDHSWTWEGRLAALDYSEHPVAPLIIYVSEGRRKHFFEWVRAQRLVSQDKLADYMRWLAEVVHDSVSPVKSAQDTLTAGR